MDRRELIAAVLLLALVPRQAPAMENPKNLRDAKKEIDRLRDQIRGLWKQLTKDSPLVEENKNDLLQLILYGDSRPGHEFDRI